MTEKWECKVGNLPRSAYLQDLNVIFWGLKIKTINMDRTKYGGFNGSAIIYFETKEDLLKALIRNGMTWEDKIITVEALNNSYCNENNDNLSMTELRENKLKDIIGIPMVKVRNVTDMPSKPKTPQEYMDCAFVSAKRGDWKESATYIYKCADLQFQLFCRKHKQDVKPEETSYFLSKVFTRMGFEWEETVKFKESTINFDWECFHEMNRVRKFCNYLSLITTLRSEE